MRTVFYFLLLCIIISCGQPKVESTETDQTIAPLDTSEIVKEAELKEIVPKPKPLNKDSLLFEKYQDEIQKKFFDEEDTLSREELDSVFWVNNQYFIGKTLIYSPDSTFKIYIIEQEGCGAHCTPEWYSWVHYNLKGVKKVQPASFKDFRDNFSTVESIHQMIDGKYLVITSSYGRSAMCLGAKLIRFTEDSMYLDQIKYRGDRWFQICQQSYVETSNGPTIEYDSNLRALRYHYGESYMVDTMHSDTVRTGFFEYKNGNFQLKEEQVEVFQRPIDADN